MVMIQLPDTDFLNLVEVSVYMFSTSCKSHRTCYLSYEHCLNSMPLQIIYKYNVVASVNDLMYCLTAQTKQTLNDNSDIML